MDYLKKKYSSESSQVREELTTLKKLMEALINHKEEEFRRQHELLENIMRKHKSLLKDLLDFSHKSEETQKKVTDLSDLIQSQAQTIEELKVKLASNEEKEEPAAAEEETQTVSSFPYNRFDELLTFSTDEEDEDDQQEEVRGGERQEESHSPPSSPRLLSFFGSTDKEEEEEKEVAEEDNQPIIISSDSESDTDNELVLFEE